MTEENETVEAVVADLVASGVVLPGEAHLAKLVALATVQRMRFDGQLAQRCLTLSPVGSGEWWRL